MTDQHIIPEYDWELKQPMAVDFGKLEGKSWMDAMKASEQRIKVFSNATTVIKSMEDQMLAIEKDFFENTIKFMNSLGKYNRELMFEDLSGRAKYEEQLQEKNPEKTTQEDEVTEAKKRVEELENDIVTNTQTIAQQSEKRKAIAEKLKGYELSNLKIPTKKSKINGLFSWMWKVVYEKPVNLYTWEQFKKEAFLKDKGSDFFHRLKGFVFQKVRPDQLEEVKKLLETEEDIYKEIEKKEINSSVRNLFAFLEVVEEVCTAIENVNRLEKELQEAQWDVEKKTTELSKVSNLVDGIQSKVGIMSKFAASLEEINPLFGKCSEILKQRIELQANFQKDMDENVTNINKLIQEAPGDMEAIFKDLGLVNQEEIKPVMNEDELKDSVSTPHFLTKIEKEARQLEVKSPLGSSTMTSIRKVNHMYETVDIQIVEPKKPPSCECNIF